MDDLPRLIVRLPELTFDQRATLHGDRRNAELITFPGGHTGSDTVLYLPTDGIVFTGDLLFVGCHPFLGDGDPVKLLEALRQIGAWQAKNLVPGHGAVGGVDDLGLLSQYAQHIPGDRRHAGRGIGRGLCPRIRRHPHPGAIPAVADDALFPRQPALPLRAHDGEPGRARLISHP